MYAHFIIMMYAWLVDNESKILHKRKNFDVAEFDKTSVDDLLTSQQKLAVFQFLSTGTYL